MKNLHSHKEAIPKLDETIDASRQTIVLKSPTLSALAKRRKFYLWSFGVLIASVCIGLFFSYVVIPIRNESTVRQLPARWNVPIRFGFTGFNH